MISVEKAIIQKFPNIEKLPKFAANGTISFFKALLKESDINNFLQKNKFLSSFEFIEAVLEYFNFSYTVSNNDKLKIPSQGKVIIIANHPLGALDALSLISLVKQTRSDIKVLANNLLYSIDQLKPILIPIDNIGENYSKESIRQVYDSLKNEEALIIFPSGEVSRVGPGGVRDTQWKKGFVKFAQKTDAPILPVYIEAKNSKIFYTISAFNKQISTLFLPREMFKQKEKTIGFKIGDTIPAKNLRFNGIDEKTTTSLLKKHLYRIAKDKKPIFATQKCIAHPESRQDLKKELKNGKLLGQTTDNKKIYLCSFEQSSPLLKEIGRLREFSFRKVEEGTGKRRDTDLYDEYYKHIILWDDEELEIVGSYRIGESNFIKKTFTNEGFYTNSLFEFKDKFEPYLSDSIELGRSFVQPKYWGSRALDYLWQGIGAYLRENQNIKYMFGPVSLSGSYPKRAKNLIIYFYEKYFGSSEILVESKNKYEIYKNDLQEIKNILSTNDYKQDFLILKEQLSHMNLTVPTLYKQYTELCEEGGIRFLDFNIDKDFADCIDSFILVEIGKIKEIKRKRYIG